MRVVPGSIPGSARHFIIFFNRQCVRVVKEADLKSVGLCPRRFKSCHCRNLSVAQLVERQTVEVNSDLLVAGSIPVAEKKLNSFFCQLKCKKVDKKINGRKLSNVSNHEMRKLIKVFSS